jgi:hypothetical protein
MMNLRPDLGPVTKSRCGGFPSGALDIGDTQAKSGYIELFYVHVRVESCVRA